MYKRFSVDWLMDSVSVGTVLRICWNGIAYLLERYCVSAGTVLRICWNGTQPRGFISFFATFTKCRL
jgi:hypothetical protein